MRVYVWMLAIEEYKMKIASAKASRETGEMV